MTVMLLSAEVSYRIEEERLLTSVVVNVLEEVLLEALGMTHLSEDLAVLADDTLDCVV